MDSKVADDFFQFDIRVFRRAMGEVNAMMRTIFASAIRSLSDSFRSVTETTHSPPEMFGAIERRALRFSDYNEEPFEMEIAAAMDFFEGSWLSDASFMRAWTVEEFDRELAGLDAIPGRSRFARIRRDILWDYSLRPKKERELRVLAGVYCHFGRDDFRQITRRQIQLAAAGFAGEDDFASFGGEVRLLSEDQVRWALDELERRGLFTSVLYGSRRRYFAVSMNQQELAARVTALHSIRAARRALKIPAITKQESKS
jgi:hypothetical protein